MALTPSQQTILKNAILGDATVSSFVAVADWYSVATIYNSPTTTNVWRNDISTVEIQRCIEGAEAVKQGTNALLLLVSLTQSPTIDATLASQRGQFATIFPASSAPLTIASMTAAAQRPGTKFETIPGFMTSAPPANVSAVFNYSLSPTDIQIAMGS